MLELNLESEARAGSISPGDLALTAVEGIVPLSDLYRFELTFMVPGDGGLSTEAQQAILRSPLRMGFGPPALEAEVFGVLSSLRMRTTDTPRDVVFDATISRPPGSAVRSTSGPMSRSRTWTATRTAPPSWPRRRIPRRTLRSTAPTRRGVESARGPASPLPSTMT